ncbi:hypothetical protein PIROE2DRAFT_14589, partial [Piromyces sp. E2]
EIVRKHFEKFGDIEYVKVLKDKAVAFVQYKLRSVAEFVKEAMYGQSLDGDEVLNVRWAIEDSNPRVQQELQRKAEEQVYNAVNANLPVIGEYGTILDYEYGYQNMPDMYGYEQGQTQAYPQVPSSAEAGDPSQYPSQYGDYYEGYYSSQYGVNPEVYQNGATSYYGYEGYDGQQPYYSQPVVTETVDNTTTAKEKDKKETENDNKEEEEKEKEKEKPKEKQGILSDASLKNIANLINKSQTKKKRPPPPPPPKSKDGKKRPPPPPPKRKNDEISNDTNPKKEGSEKEEKEESHKKVKINK